MIRGHDLPVGLVGVTPRDPVGCHVSTAIKGQNGTPDWKGRFFITTQQTHSEEFTSGRGSRFRSLARSLHPSFTAWNNGAFKLGEELSRKGPGRFGTLRGNLVHARWQDAALWHRAAQKLPEGHPNPSLTRRPACEGNGISALRFQGIEDNREVYKPIACPNRECLFAQSGACKPAGHLIFRLRWNQDDPVEAGFPSLLAEWSTRGWESLENLMGLLEIVLGTEALLTEEERKLAPPEQRAKWRTGLAHEMGIEQPSLVGLPFVMTVGERTRAADEKNPSGKRFTVISFSPDGDLVAWLLAQARNRRELSGGPTLAAGLLPATVGDPDFMETVRHESRVEIDPSVIEITAEAPPDAPVKIPGEALREVDLLSAKQIEAILTLADERKVGRIDLANECVRLVGTGNLEAVPEAFHTEILRFIDRRAQG